MSRIENSIAVPVRRFTNPLRLSLGSMIALSGVAVLLGHLLPTL
ncbi:hypothetical protein PX699_13770 [Sphingobium sp. H39-3-25]|nr:hypothetical protein [Sphingobium arseniciresistens]